MSASTSTNAESMTIQSGGETVLRFHASPDAVSSPMGAELALLDFRTNAYFTLNDTGAAVWARLAEPASLDELCGHLAEQFEVEPEDCRDDVAGLLSELRAAGLVDAVDAPRA